MSVRKAIAGIYFADNFYYGFTFLAPWRVLGIDKCSSLRSPQPSTRHGKANREMTGKPNRKRDDAVVGLILFPHGYAPYLRLGYRTETQRGVVLVAGGTFYHKQVAYVPLHQKCGVVDYVECGDYVEFIVHRADRAARKALQLSAHGHDQRYAGKVGGFKHALLRRRAVRPHQHAQPFAYGQTDKVVLVHVYGFYALQDPASLQRAV